MKKYILMWLYSKYGHEFNDMLVQDYICTIPTDAKADLLSLFQSHKDKLRRANDFLAFSLHRRMATDIRHSERYQGMFIQLKIFDALLKTVPDSKEKKLPDAKKEKKTFDYKTVVGEVIGKMKKSNTQG